jgi:hypothetical protein
MKTAPPSYAAGMQFTGSPGVLLTNAWDIFGDGEITGHTADNLREFLEKQNVPSMGSTLFLNSPGGDLVGGMQLGGAIRSLGLSTAIGTARGAPSSAGVINPFSLKIDPGGCYSACTLAFMGGIWRFNDERSAFGVHRFYFTKPSQKAAESSQIVSGVIVDYMRQMGINPEAFSLMTTASAQGIRLLSLADQKNLGIVNEGEGPTTWQIVSQFVDKGIMYLRGSRDSMYGMNKFIIGCQRSRGAQLIGMFQSSHRRKEILGSSEHFLWINEKEIPLPNNRISVNDDDVVAIDAPLSQELLAAIEQAKTVGVGVDAGENAAIFLGFIGMPFTAEAERDLRGLLQLCQ